MAAFCFETFMFPLVTTLTTDTLTTPTITKVSLDKWTVTRVEFVYA